MEARDAKDGPILLVGMMGCGKSTVGPALARRLARDFVDVDDEIEARAGRTLPEIFETDGEAAFRTLERDTLAAVLTQDPVVALGGGALAQPGAPEWLAKLGTVVYLRASLDSLMGRVGHADGRPLLAGLDEASRRERLEEILRDRQAAYESARLVVDTDEQSVEQIVLTIAEDLGIEP